MTILFSNNAETTLQVAALLADTSMTVKAGDSGLFNVLAAGQTELVTLTDGVNYEVVEITAWAGDVATITRGIEGTAQAWGIGTLFSGRVTAGALAKMVQTADLPPAPTPAPVNSIGLHSSQHILVADTAIDLGLLAPDAVPGVIVKDVGGVTATVTMPTTTTGNAYRIVFMKNDSRINVAVPAGETLNATLNGTDFASASDAVSMDGANGIWKVNFWA